MASACEKCGYFPVRRCKCEEVQLQERIQELEAKFKSANDILNSQSFWCELADQECVGMKSIVYLVKKALKGDE